MQRESSTTTQHEATPWRFYLTDEGFDIYQDRDGYGDAICSIPGEPVAEANRAFAERAVNSHAALVEALENATFAMRGAAAMMERLRLTKDAEYAPVWNALHETLAALAAAKGTR